ncbi:unnamed protein product [Medioppia subpectinata]|uniref:DUF19 domain-containing protein n=1 Tax=Medioppia subpectinata TaxID=1979941 RepID=A0A7R9KSL1_9ACAR|nr:unnamed protein product [Medioppia subpectinata]CAG2109085.1 unnamed protein product [Medioppia subpectinata]
MAMNLTIILHCLTFTILIMAFKFGHAQKSDKNSCKTGTDSIDTCFMNLLLFGDPKYVFPENMTSMNTHCRQIKTYDKCIKEYTNKCLAPFPKQVSNVLAYGGLKTHKAYCATKRRKESFTSVGKCANKIKRLGDNCMYTFIDEIQGSENYPDVKMKLPLVCCNFYKFKECIINHGTKVGEPLCKESHIEETERIIGGYANDVLALVCGDYTEDSDKCGKILPKTPKKLPSQKRPKSIILPFINILASVPQK